MWVSKRRGNTAFNSLDILTISVIREGEKKIKGQGSLLETSSPPSRQEIPVEDSSYLLYEFLGKEQVISSSNLKQNSTMTSLEIQVMW